MQKQLVSWFSHQVEFFNKKSKKNLKIYGALYGLGLTVSKLQSHYNETVFLNPGPLDWESYEKKTQIIKIFTVT